MEVNGARIRALREDLKRRTDGRKGSQTWLGAEIGAHPTSVSDWERGVTQPSTRHLHGIAAALGVTIESLYTSVSSEGGTPHAPFPEAA